MELFSNSIPHIPEHTIRDRTRIGNDWLWTQYVLVFEECEFRVYHYEYEELFNVINQQERDDCCEYFYNFDYALKRDTLAYTRLDIEEWVKETINDLLIWVDNYLDSDETPMDLKERITNLIKDNIKNLGTRVYQYYK